MRFVALMLQYFLIFFGISTVCNDGRSQPILHNEIPLTVVIDVLRFTMHVVCCSYPSLSSPLCIVAKRKPYGPELPQIICGCLQLSMKAVFVCRCMAFYKELWIIYTGSAS